MAIDVSFEIIDPLGNPSECHENILSMQPMILP